jgi:ERCC4-type nuclease
MLEIPGGLNMKLIIDSRENSDFSSEVIRKANRINIANKKEFLEVGDYVIGDACFEAKSAQDFLQSIMNKRMWLQVDNMDKNYNNNFVVIYGTEEQALAKVMKYMKTDTNQSRQQLKNRLKLQFKGAIGRLRLDYGMNVIWRDTLEDAAEELVTLAKMIPVKREIIRPSILKRVATDDVRVDMLTTIKGISAKKAEELLEEYGCIMEIGCCKTSEITTIKGIGKTVADRILNVLNSEQKVKQ